MLRLQIFTRARESPSFTSAPPTGDGGSLTTFFKEVSKIGLKCNILALITSGHKTFKNLCDLRQLSSLSANISGIDEDSGVDENDLFGVEQKKICEISSTTNQVISANVDLP